MLEYGREGQSRTGCGWVRVEREIQIRDLHLFKEMYQLSLMFDVQMLTAAEGKMTICFANIASTAASILIFIHG